MSLFCNGAVDSNIVEYVVLMCTMLAEFALYTMDVFHYKICIHSSANNQYCIKQVHVSIKGGDPYITHYLLMLSEEFGYHSCMLKP